MPPVELEGLRETFESIDKSNSGTISLEELTSHLQVKNCNATAWMGLSEQLNAPVQVENARVQSSLYNIFQLIASAA